MRPCHFNAGKNVCEEMFCKKCSQGFHDQAMKFIEMNTHSITKLTEIADADEIDLQNFSKFTTNVKNILNIVYRFNAMSESRGNWLGEWGDTESFRFYEQALYPITKQMMTPTFRQFLNEEFGGEIPDHLNYDELKKFYQFTLEVGQLRNDILMSELTVYADDVEDFEEEFGVRLVHFLTQRTYNLYEYLS